MSADETEPLVPNVFFRARLKRCPGLGDGSNKGENSEEKNRALLYNARVGSDVSELLNENGCLRFITAGKYKHQNGF